ncbi:hypothetical protein TSUD_301190 [Trifolium subterraneum]|uniref:Protein SDA1 n=1 Tax=Trifolium subterraneum TaxID=3900 RepID=A0A2Z6PJ78_TRISU|nr:hypothetical protein TSUD_301190 [Trifolium subterraneum]
MPSHGGVPVAEALLPSGRNPERLSLPALQSKMKCDPEGYESELLLIRSQFDSSLELFKQQADMNFTSISGISNDPTVARDLAEKAMFLSHVTSFFPQHLTDFPHKLAELLHRAARTLPSGLRNDLAKSLILLINRQIISIKEMLPLFMELQTLGDKALRELAFKHIVKSIKRMNLKHKDEAKNRALQNILFVMLQKEDEDRARRALVTLCDLHKRQIWFDERTANAICTACFHPSSRIMISSLCFLLDYEKIENYQDSDDSSSDEDMTESPQVILRRETIYKVKMMMLKVIARTVGLHQLILLNFYPYLQKYIQPHQRDVTNLLAAAVQACHDMVPPDAVEPLFKQIVNQFVHDRSRPEAITVGINAVREICLRMPLLMNEDLLQDLALYKKSHEKGVSIAARSLIALFREVCPSLLIKKDRGRPTNPTARPKAYGEVNVATDVPDAELLQTIDDDVEQESLNSDDSVCSGSDNDQETKKRKFSDFNDQLTAADSSLRALKKLAGTTMEDALPENEDGILSNEDFQRIKKLKAKQEARTALAQHGLVKSIANKFPSSDQLSLKRVDGSMLEAHVKRKLNKQERLEMVKAGREERGKYQARAAVKQKKTGGLSNKQKEHKKIMPIVAKRKKMARTRIAKRKKDRRSGKQQRGKKAWKQ